MSNNNQNQQNKQFVTSHSRASQKPSKKNVFAEAFCLKAIDAYR